MERSKTPSVGDLVLHREAGLVGRVKRFWEAGTWNPAGKELPPLEEAVVELDDGNCLLAEVEGGEGRELAFDVLSEAEAIFHRQMVALLAHTLKESVPLAKAIGIELPRAKALFAASLNAQARALGGS